MDIAVDLGSDRTRVFIENKGIVLDEASVVALMLTPTTLSASATRLIR